MYIDDNPVLYVHYQLLSLMQLVNVENMHYKPDRNNTDANALSRFPKDHNTHSISSNKNVFNAITGGIKTQTDFDNGLSHERVKRAKIMILKDKQIYPKDKVSEGKAVQRAFRERKKVEDEQEQQPNQTSIIHLDNLTRFNQRRLNTNPVD